MTSAALIVFVKNILPDTGYTEASGTNSAFKIYTRLHQHTLECTRSQDCERYVFYSDFIPSDDEWIRYGFKPCLQHGIDQGERMLNASLFVFSRGFKHVVIVGGDRFELDREQITESFKILEDTNVVIGPAVDGKYYLLGTNNLYPFLFFNKSWNTSHLLNETIKELNSHELSFSLLPVLNNIDFENDLPWNFREELFQGNKQDSVNL